MVQQHKKFVDDLTEKLLSRVVSLELSAEGRRPHRTGSSTIEGFPGDLAPSTMKYPDDEALRSLIGVTIFAVAVPSDFSWLTVRSDITPPEIKADPEFDFFLSATSRILLTASNVSSLHNPRSSMLLSYMIH